MKPEAFKGAIDVMMAAIHAAESFAQELGEVSAVAAKDGNLGFAEATLALCRQHRVEAIRLRAGVAALSARHGLAPKGT